MRGTPAERFAAKLRTVGRCQIFGKTGVTAFFLDGKDYSPRVAAWFLHYGRMPKGTLRSECGTRLCCKVGHLRDIVQERGARSRRFRVHYDRNRTFTLASQSQRLSSWLERHSPHLREVPCPVCGGPPVHGTCPHCEVDRAA